MGLAVGDQHPVVIAQNKGRVAVAAEKSYALATADRCIYPVSWSRFGMEESVAIKNCIAQPCIAHPFI